MPYIQTPSITFRVRDNRTGEVTFKLRPDMNFQLVYQCLSERSCRPISDFILTYNNNVITFDETPLTLHINHNDLVLLKDL